VRRHVAPHAIHIAALWAVLTRLKRAQPEHFESSALGRIAADLTPIEKADLYAHGTLPRRLSAEEARDLAGGIDDLAREWETEHVYEGLTGASPREIRTVLLEAANDPDRAILSPLGVIDRLDAFCARTDHDFLKQSPERGYMDHKAFVRQVHDRWLDHVDDELRSSTGLVEEAQHRELFDRYVTHVSFWVKKEKAYNQVTGKYEDPDEDLMKSVEEMLAVDSEHETFRKNLISAVAGQAIDNPGEKVDYQILFPRHIEKVREAYYGAHKKQVGIIARDILSLIDAGDSIPAGLDDARQKDAERSLEAMKTRYAYIDESVREAVGELVEERYEE